MKCLSMSATGRFLFACALAFGLVGAVVVPRVQAQTFSVIYNFAGPRGDGGLPLAGLVIDAAGNLYGTASYGGSTYNGAVFKVTESGQETVLYNFAGGTVDGANPQSSLIMDRGGDLYGTTYAGGAHGTGTVFELGKNGKETVLYSFAGGTDGANPVAGVTRDAKGNFYGTTSAGGTSGYGTVFQLTPVPVSASSSLTKYKESVLHNFTHQNDGDVPYAGLILDGAGNLYGGATGGGANNGGTIFELTPSSGSWNFNVLYSLPGWDISGAWQNLLLDSSGNIWGTTHCDGTYEAGTVYKLTNSGGTWNYTSMYVFTGGTDGIYSISTPVFDTQGNLYGTAEYGGANNNGVVYKITP